jgi:hypothetical protein
VSQEQEDAMNLTDKDEMLVRRYLLGGVTDEEREQVELQLMTDHQYFNYFLKTEESLIDEYVKGELSQYEKEPFERFFLSAPERRDKLEFSKSLSRYIAESENRMSADTSRADLQVTASPSTFAWFWQTQGRTVMLSLVVVILVLLAGTILLVAENARSREQIREQLANSNHTEGELRQLLDEQKKRNEELAQQLEQSQNEVSRIEQELASLKQAKGSQQESIISRIASLILSPGSVRDNGQINRVKLSNQIQQLNLALKLHEEEYESYQIEVKTAEGKSLWKDGNLRVQQRKGEKIIIATIPASHLPEGDYLITLSVAIADGSYKQVATYFFTILRY